MKKYFTGTDHFIIHAPINKISSLHFEKEIKIKNSHNIELAVSTSVSLKENLTGVRDLLHRKYAVYIQSTF